MDQDETWRVRVGLGPGHTALDRETAPPPQRGTAPPQFLAHMLRPNGWMDQYATWYGARPRPRRLCWMGTPLPFPKGGGAPHIFGPCLLWPNGWIDQDGTWHGGIDLSRGDFVLYEDPGPAPKGSGAASAIFGPCLLSSVVKRLDGSRWHLAWRWASVQATLCWMGTQLPPSPPKKGQTP